VGVNVQHPAPRTIAGLAATIALTLAACGGSDDSAATTVPDTVASTQPTATTGAPVSEPSTVSVTDPPEGTPPSPATTEPASDAAAITIANFAFSGVAEVPVGTTVTVTNTDNTQHTWSADDGTFDSGALSPGESFEFTFDEAGSFAYFCNFHPSMSGTIVVTG
jgi:plastocyanin